MKRPSVAELNRYIVDAGFGGHLVPTTVVLVRDVLRPSFFSSWACVQDTEGDWHMWPCRTVPTESELKKSSRHKDGTAILTPGKLNRRCWTTGYHNPRVYGNQRPCMRQVGMLAVHRDDDGDGTPEWTRSSKIWDNAHGVNLHDYRGSSAGCPTMQEQDMVTELLDVVRAHGEDRWDLLVIEPLFECES
jgi:hypothetical protein